MIRLISLFRKVNRSPGAQPSKQAEALFVEVNPSFAP